MKKSDVKKGLIELRQDPEHADIKPLIRATLDLIEKQEKRAAKVKLFLETAIDTVEEE